MKKTVEEEASVGFLKALDLLGVQRHSISSVSSESEIVEQGSWADENDDEERRRPAEQDSAIETAKPQSIQGLSAEPLGEPMLTTLSEWSAIIPNLSNDERSSASLALIGLTGMQELRLSIRRCSELHQ